MLKKGFIAWTMACTLPFAAHAADVYTVDPAHTFPNFTVSHLGFSTMHGRFDKTSGKVTLDMAKKTGTVDVTVDTSSISTGFAKRDDHLKSPDFFDVSEYPTMTFKADSMKFKGDTPVEVNGKLTLLGVTKPVTLNITAFKCGTNPMSKKDECGAAATAQIKRSDFGMKAFLPAVGDEISMEFEIEAIKD